MGLVSRLFRPNRTVTVESAAIPRIGDRPALVPVRLCGTEAVGELGDGYTLELKSPVDTDIAWCAIKEAFQLNEMVGREITVAIELDGKGAESIGAGKREITGIISQARYLRREGRTQLYAVTIQPWPYLMTLSTTYRAFQNKALSDILNDIFAAYPYPVEMRLKPENFPVRDYQVQFGQSDFEYFQYLTQEFGVTWHMEYAEGRQRLVLCDGLLGHEMHPNPAYQTLSFYRDGFRIDEEHVERFELVDQLTSGAWRTNDYDYSRSLGNLANTHRDPRTTGENDRAVYEWPGDYSQPKAGARLDQDPWEEGAQIARIRMQMLRATGSRAIGAGNLRGVAPGYAFLLQNHPHSAANREYLVLSAHLDLEEVAQETGQARHWRCRVNFEAHPLNEPYRPQRTVKKPCIGGMITATVTGPKDAEVYTDEFGRIKVLPHYDDHKVGDENSSLWVRVSSAWAGMNFGAMHLPRVHDEVLLSFEAGDPDRPVVTGRVVNQWRGTPWELPSQHALSGFRSQELGGSGRSNHLLMDDTRSQIQAQLSSDHQYSQLNLGYVTRVPDRAGRRNKAGEGFELRTDGGGAIRAGSGLHLTAFAQRSGTGDVFAAREALERAESGLEQSRTLGELAQKHHAGDFEHNQAFAGWLKDAKAAQRGGEKGEAAPHQSDVLVSTPANHVTVAAHDQIHLSGKATHQVVGHSMNQSIGKDWVVSAKGVLSHFVYGKTGEVGWRQHLGRGNLQLQAQDGSIEVIAKEVLKLLSTGKLEIAAKEILITAGGDSIHLGGGGGIEYRSGTQHKFKGGMGYDAPATTPYPLPQLPKGVCVECLLKSLGAGPAFAAVA